MPKINDGRETAIEYLACDEYATFYSGEEKWKRKIRKFASHPSDVTIKQDNEWGLIATFPKTWIKVKPPIQRYMTDEQRKKASERMLNIINEKKLKK